MEFRLWIGIWCAVLLVSFSVFNLSFLVKYITRFTEDCFASLVAIMFIIDAIKSTIGIYADYPTRIGNNKLFNNQQSSNECLCNNTANNLTNDTFINNNTITGLDGCTINGTFVTCKAAGKLYPDVFIFSILLFITTFSICLILKSFRGKSYFPAKVMINLYMHLRKKSFNP